MRVIFDEQGYSRTAGEVTAYHVMPDSREYCGSSSQLLPIGVGLPAQAYLEAPPEPKAGFAVCRTSDGKAWEYLADHRGETRYSTKSKQAVVITELGDYPADTTARAPAPFDEWDGEGWVLDVAALAAANLQAAKEKKARLKAQADAEISWRQDAVDFDGASEEEIAALAAWRTYRVAVMRLDVMTAPPESAWPALPGNEQKAT